MHIVACKEFYANLTVYIYKKKEIARSRVRGVEIEFDSMRLASILGVPGNNGICEYIKEVWEESKYIKPLEITKKFANDDMLTATKRVRLAEMKPFQRLMMRHMAYVIFVEYHEFPYGDWLTMVFETFNVPLIDKQGQEPKRRRDDEDEIPAENDQNEEVVEGQNNETDFDWEAVIDEVEIKGEDVNEDAEIQEESGSAEKFYDAKDEDQGSADVIEEVSSIPAPTSVQQKETAASGVDPSAPTGSIPDSVFVSLQAELERARADRIQDELDRAQAENARILALLQQAKSQPKP
ncbi:hypothetical protein Dimus_000819 [Dionaea muscipula]